MLKKLFLFLFKDYPAFLFSRFSLYRIALFPFLLIHTLIEKTNDQESSKSS